MQLRSWSTASKTRQATILRNSLRNYICFVGLATSISAGVGMEGGGGGG